MRTKIHFITTPSTVLGYKLAGINVTGANTDEDAFKLFQKLVKQPDIGIIGLEESIYNKINPNLIEEIETRQNMIILEIPSQARFKMEKAAIQEYLWDKIQSSAGFYFRVNLIKGED
jgi:vacuolar-type H+-ATPase subunit F/Vma7